MSEIQAEPSKDSKKEHVLIVEGNSEKHVILAICKAYSVPELFDIEVAGNNEKARKRFVAAIADSQYKKVGVLLDNEPDQNVWDYFQNELPRYAAYYKDVLPKSLTGEGLIIKSKQEHPHYDDYGIWLMPDNSSKGTLEGFLIETRHNTSSSLWTFAETTLVGLEANSPPIHKYKSVHRNKALIHTYLAWHEQPGSPYGLSFTQGAFDLTHAKVKALAEWLCQLFG
jgi:hypothetical protein